MRLAIVAVMALVMLGSPELRTAIGDGVTKLLTPHIETQPEPTPQPVKKQHSHPKRSAKDTTTTP